MKNRFSLVKFFIFLLVFVIVLFLFFILYIVPIMKEYKSNKVVLKKYEKIYKAKSRQLKSLTLLKNDLSNKYKKEIKVVSSQISETSLKKLANRFFDDVVFSDKQVGKDYLKYNIVASMQDENKLLSFIQELSRFKNLIKIDFPIEIKKLENKYKVNFNVTIVHKKLK